jgi:hypothetical protein
MTTVRDASRLFGQSRALRRSVKTVICISLAASWGCTQAERDRSPVAGASPGVRREPMGPEAVWLRQIGVGASQMRHVCESGADDRVTRSLCKEPAPKVDSLVSLYEALGLVGANERLVAVATHSVGLATRFVSAANPRTFVFLNNITYAPLPHDKLAVVSFARGEQLVELVALDTRTYDWNFYLLAFDQDCNRSGCTPEQLLTESVERDWTGFTLYSDRDLVDTPLDCLSCHLPYGAGTHKLLLMRQFPDPWLHWGDFRGVNETADCAQDGPKASDPGRHVAGDGLDLLLALEGPEGRYGGVPVRELADSQSGRLMSDFCTDARLTINDSPYGGNYPQLDHELRTGAVLCELLDAKSSSTWQLYRDELAPLGLPVPAPTVDVTDPAKRKQILADRAGYLNSLTGASAFDVASGLLAPEVLPEVGIVPREQDGVPEILHQMCGRCHGRDTPADLGRAAFDATALDHFTPASGHEVNARIRLPRHSPSLMPPLRSGELPPWAIDRITAYIDQRCTDPRPRACR